MVVAGVVVTEVVLAGTVIAGVIIVEVVKTGGTVERSQRCAVVAAEIVTAGMVVAK